LKWGLTEMAIAVSPWSVYFSFLFSLFEFWVSRQNKKKGGGEDPPDPLMLASMTHAGEHDSCLPTALL
jgi:hypothetical protein